MRLMQIVRKPRELCSRFAKWRNFHSRYGLAQGVVYISTGHSQLRWSWLSGTLSPLDSRALPEVSVFKLTRRVQLTLVRYYVFRAHIISEPDGLSKQVRK